jgi:nitronate monooxygenase
VRVGTRFAATEEAGAHPEYLATLITATAEDTVYTDVFAVGWPDGPHRCLRSSVAAAEAFAGEVVAEGVDRYTGERYPIRRFQSHPAYDTTSGTIAALPFWAGESVGGVTRVLSAAEVVRELAGEAEQLLKRWC